MIPFESYNLLYRDGAALARVRASIAAQTAQRHGPRATIPIAVAAVD